MIYIKHPLSGFVSIELGQYPDGTYHVPKDTHDFIADSIQSLNKLSKDTHRVINLTIKADLRHSKLEQLLVVFEILLALNFHPSRVNLVLGYLPYARDDLYKTNPYRMKLKGLVPNVLSGYGIKDTEVYDQHSDEYAKTTRLVPSLLDIPLSSFGDDLSSLGVIIPDKGAANRSITYGRLGNHTVFYQCDKVRTQEGVVTHLPDSLTESNLNEFVIYDDICDGGSTFVNIVNELRKHKPDVKVILCVSHFLNTAKYDLSKYFTEVRCMNTLHQFPDQPLTAVIDVINNTLLD